MNELDRVYGSLLQAGFLVLRQAIDSGNEDWVRAEVEFLHNVPSLLDEENAERHRYFWNWERTYYLDWLKSHGNEEAQSRMRTYYEPIFEELQPLIAERLADHGAEGLELETLPGGELGPSSD
jgi:hypothetical protein